MASLPYAGFASLTPVPKLDLKVFEAGFALDNPAQRKPVALTRDALEGKGPQRRPRMTAFAGLNGICNRQ